MHAEARDTQAREDRADRRLRHRGVLGGTHRLAPRRVASPDRIRGLLPRRLYRDGTARKRSDPEEMRVPPHRVRPAARPWRGLGPPVHRLRAADRPSRDPRGSCQTRRCRTGAGATFPASTGAAGTTTAASHLRPGTRGSLIFHRPASLGARQPPAEATVHGAVARHLPARQPPTWPPPSPPHAAAGARAEHPDPYHLEAIQSGPNRRPMRRILRTGCRLVLVAGRDSVGESGWRRIAGSGVGRCLRLSRRDMRRTPGPGAERVS